MSAATGNPELPPKPFVLPEELRGLSDPDWLARISGSDVVPGLPDEAATIKLTGVPIADALEHAAAFYPIVKAYCDALAMPLAPHRRVLDFGAGWGCLSRFFVRDVDADKIFSCEFDPALVGLGRASQPIGPLDQLYAGGRLPYADNAFDCIVAYSALAQLAPAAHLHWLRELARVASPGCVLTFTVEPRRFLEAPADGPSPVAGADELLKAYDRGDIAYVAAAALGKAATGAPGHAVVPVEFIRRHWKPPFELRDTIDEAQRFSRAVVIVQHG